MPRLELLLVIALLSGCASAGAGQVAPQASRSLSSDGRYNLGLAQKYLETNKLKEARQRAEMVLASDPGSAEVHALFAMVHDREGNPAKAEREFERAVKIAPTDGAVLNAYGAWLCGRGKADLADQHFLRALQDPLYRTPFQALANAGRCAHHARNWAKAEFYLRRGLALAPEDKLILLMLADTEYHQGKLMEARAFIQRRDALGSDATTLDLAARIEDSANDRHAAARYRQRLKDQFPNHVPTGEGARTP